MRTNYVLIDSENVRPESLNLLQDECFRVLVFMGANQNKVLLNIVKSLQPFGTRAEYIQIAGNGPNALDFHIAFYIGKLAEKEPNSFFHIISKDTGFDPLISHLKDQKIFAARVTTISDIKLVRTKTAPSSEREKTFIEHLQQSKASRPSTIKTLSNSISAIFQKQLSTEEVEAIKNGLVKRGIVSINGTKVTYNLPD